MPLVIASNPTYPAFPIFSCLGFILVLIPLPWHLQAWNSGTCLYMIWTALGCLNAFVNSILWRGDTIDRAPIWCDISSRLIVGLAVALPAASLCINRRLYNIATIQTVGISKDHKRRAVCLDLAIGLGIPVIQMALQYIVEGHRYNIFEDIGCYPALFNTPPAYPLTIVWPTVIGLISLVYCVLTLRAFVARRADFNQFLSSNTNSSLTVNRYFRLMALATVEILINTPLSAYGIYLNAVDNPIQPWKGWADAHFEYSAVDLFPAIEWRSSLTSVLSLELSRWSLVFCAFLFFAFFGLAGEARKNYRLAFQAIARGFSTSSSDTLVDGHRHKLQRSGKVATSDLPIYVHHMAMAAERHSPISKLHRVHTMASDSSSFSSHMTPGVDARSYYPSPNFPPSPTLTQDSHF